ncbi:MAG: DHHA1 domain-containing protein [Patescibacteria group bacterium]|nr:DHHA1 domain-containing protein [Patescibacteria group bacterium]
MIDKQIVVIYHKRCEDGFGAAYAAWKKFGDTAEYIPAGYGGEDAPEELAGKEVYILDFCYEQHGTMERLISTTKKLVVLDHHQSSRGLVESIPESIFDANRSGATIAWSYFHPSEPMPRLMTYLEDGDTYRYSLPETRDIFSYLVVQPYDFAIWDDIVRRLEDDSERKALLAKAVAYTEYFERLSDICAEAAKKVRFESYECYFATTLPSITMRSYVAHKLYEKLPPIALIVTAHPDGFGVSIRSDGSVDVAEIAEKYGGGGHPGSAGFFIPNGAEMPWTEIEE